jgi:hypothetical protein
MDLTLDTWPWKSLVSASDPSAPMLTTPTVMSSLHDTILDDANTTLWMALVWWASTAIRRRHLNSWNRFCGETLYLLNLLLKNLKSFVKKHGIY